MDLLLFSYQCLPLHLQRCFAYCSLFPKGYKFNFDVQSGEPHLISLWIAQGFIENTTELTLEEEGKKYIEELLSYSFFEKTYYHSGSRDYFVIHDLLHDLAENVSKKKQCIHLSLCVTNSLVSVDMSNMVVISDIFKLRNLRSLISLQHDGSTNSFKSQKDIIQNLTKLRALYVEDQQMEVLSDPRIDKLKHLRYLHVRYNSKLPTSLTKLYQLQFFILTTSNLHDGSGILLANTLPQGFSNLFKHILKFYHYGSNYELDYLYYNSEMINIEKLTSLQNLKIFHCYGFNGMISLRNLPLGKFLSILNLENVKCKEEAEEAMLNQKKNLNELIFKWSNTQSSIDTCRKVFEGLEPHRNLEVLKIEGYQGVRFPNWMVKENWLPRLQTLSLTSCTSLKIVPFLPPRLQNLYVHDCDELMQLPPFGDTLRDLVLSKCPKLTPPSMFNKSSDLSDLSFLANLERLILEGLPNLQALTNLSSTVTNLNIKDCPKITSLGNLQRCTLEFLGVYNCPMLREEPTLVEGVVEGDIVNRLPHVEWIGTDERLLVLDLVQQQASSIKRLHLLDCAALPNLEVFSSLQTLAICNCRDVESLPKLPVSLQSLNIFKCPKLKKFEDGGPLHLDLKGCGALSNLENLTSLHELIIGYCPTIESLPNLPVSLRELRVYGCPKLKEKYEEGGPLHNTISHLPEIYIR